MDVAHVKEAISLRWFRVLQALNLIKGRGGQHEKVVDDYHFLKIFSVINFLFSWLFRRE